MSIFRRQKRYKMPQSPQSGSNGLVLARNGMPPHASSFQELARLANGVSARRMRVLLQQEWGFAGSATAAASTQIYSGVFRTSQNMETAHVRAVAIPANTTLTTEVPRLDFYIGKTSNTGIGNMIPSMYVNKRRASGTPVPNDLFYIDSPITSQTIVSNSEYHVRVLAQGYARLKSICIFEQQNDTARFKEGIANMRPDAFMLTIVSPFGVNETRMYDNDAFFDDSYLGMTVVISGATGDNDGTYTVTAAGTDVYGGNYLQLDNPSGGPSTFSTTAAGGDARYTIYDKIIASASIRVATPITSGHVQSINDNIRDTWKRSGGRLFDWSEPVVGIAAAGSWAELHSGATTDAARNPGHTVYVEKSGSYESTNVPCIAWIDVMDSHAIDVEFRKSDGTVLAEFDAATRPGVTHNDGYHTVAFNLDSSESSTKIHVWAKKDSGGAPTLRAYGAYQYEAPDVEPTPLTIVGSTGIEWWFRQDFGMTTYDPGSGIYKITNWADKGPNGYDLVSDGTDDPSIKTGESDINEYDAVWFTGVGDEQLSFPTSTGIPATGWVFLVGKNLSANSSNKHMTMVRMDAATSGDRPNMWFHMTGSGTKPVVYDATASDKLTYSFGRSEWSLYEMGYRETSTLRSITASYYSQFAATGPASTDTNTSGTMTATGNNWESLGYDDGGASWSDPCNFYVTELFCMNRKPTSDELDAIRAYFIARYGWT